MRLQKTTILDIVFSEKERIKTAQFVSEKIKQGWFVQDGEIRNGEAFGDYMEGESHKECIQIFSPLYKYEENQLI